MEVSSAKTKIPTAPAETMEMEGPHRTRAGTRAAVTAAKLVPTASAGTPTMPNPSANGRAWMRRVRSSTTRLTRGSAGSGGRGARPRPGRRAKLEPAQPALAPGARRRLHPQRPPGRRAKPEPAQPGLAPPPLETPPQAGRAAAGMALLLRERQSVRGTTQVPWRMRVRSRGGARGWRSCVSERASCMRTRGTLTRRMCCMSASWRWTRGTWRLCATLRCCSRRRWCVS